MIPYIIHINPIAFLASIAILKEPKLKDESFIVGFDGVSRARALAVSTRAYRLGMKPNDRIDCLLRTHGKLKVIEPSLHEAEEITKEIHRICLEYTPRVEKLTLGHAYLDTEGSTALFGSPETIASTIQRRISQEFSIPVSIGIAPNKLVARVATRFAKPLGLITVHEPKEFMRQLDLELLPYLDAKKLRTLSLLGIQTCGDLLQADAKIVAQIFGAQAQSILRMAQGLDEVPVLTTLEKFIPITVKKTLDEETNNPEIIQNCSAELATELGYSIRSRDLTTRELELCVFYTDGMESRNIHKLRHPKNLDKDLMKIVSIMIDGANQRRVKVRRLELEARKLEKEDREQELFILAREDRSKRFQSAIDFSRNRYGLVSLQPARII